MRSFLPLYARPTKITTAHVRVDFPKWKFIVDGGKSWEPRWGNTSLCRTQLTSRGETDFAAVLQLKMCLLCLQSRILSDISSGNRPFYVWVFLVSQSVNGGEKYLNIWELEMTERVHELCIRQVQPARAWHTSQGRSKNFSGQIWLRIMSPTAPLNPNHRETFTRYQMLSVLIIIT